MAHLTEGLLTMCPGLSSCFYDNFHRLSVSQAVSIHVPRLHASLPEHIVDQSRDTNHNN